MGGDFLRPRRRSDRSGQVRRLPPAGGPWPHATHHLRADQGLLADDPRGAADPPHAAVPAGRHGRPLGAQRGPVLRSAQDPGALDRGRLAARRRRGSARQPELPCAALEAGHAGRGSALPPVDVPATGVLPYQNPVVATNMSEGRWLKASEFLVTDKKVLHHVTTTLSSPGETGAMIRQEMAAGGIGGQGPGRVINLVPKDMGVWVPANADIHMQTHYTPYGKPTTEATKVGLYFYPKGQEPKYPMRTYGVYGTGITIPAGEEYHPEVAYADIPKDMLVYGLTAHAHVRGGSTQVSILYPDGHEEIVLAVPRYDFNWQCEFYLEKPIMVPAGSRIINRWTYDNSTRNHGNTDPKKDIVFGEQTTDEMLTFFIHYRWIGETVAKPHGDYDQLMAKGQLMGALDSNMDGKLEPSELRGTVGQKLKANFAALDKNHDGVLDAEELAAATVRGPNLVRPKQTASESAGGRPVASN